MDNLYKNCMQCDKGNKEDYCHVTLNSIMKLKESTRKLLNLLDDIQEKTYSKYDSNYATVKQIMIQNHDNDDQDNCTIYEKLTGRCRCLNGAQYNDFVMQFNENVKHQTTSLGEIIKNLRLLKKFVYMGGDYTKYALLFLNEGLSESTATEKTDIIAGCAYADICNIFDEHTIVSTHISWPCKDKNYLDLDVQALTAGLLYKLSQSEDGKRYINLNSKIVEDIKKVIQKKASKLEYDTLEALNTTLNMLQPPLMSVEPTVNIAFCKPIEYTKGMTSNIINVLRNCHHSMTANEVLTHLDILRNMSNSDNGKNELNRYLKSVFDVFRNLLIQYDNSEMNILLTNILDNIVPKNSITEDNCVPPILKLQPKRESYYQTDSKKYTDKNINKSKVTLSRKKHNASKKLREGKEAIIVVPVDSDTE